MIVSHNAVPARNNMGHALIDQSLAGKPFPLGATCTPEGVNFGVYSKNATAVELLLFRDPLAQSHLLNP